MTRFPTVAPRIWLAAAAVLAALGILLRVVYAPLARQIGVCYALLRQAEQHTAAAALTLETEQLPVDADYARLARRLIEDRSLPQFLEALSRRAAACQVALTAVSPSAGDQPERLTNLGPKVTLRELPVTVQLAGRYRALSALMRALDDLPGLVSVRRLRLTSDEAAPNRCRAELHLTVWLAQ